MTAARFTRMTPVIRKSYPRLRKSSAAPISTIRASVFRNDVNVVLFMMVNSFMGHLRQMRHMRQLQEAQLSQKYQLS